MYLIQVYEDYVDLEVVHNVDFEHKVRNKVMAVVISFMVVLISAIW